MDQNDLIYREDAIDALERTDWYHHDKDLKMVHGANDAEHQAWYKAEDVYKAINSVPSAQQWIPCSERLPKEVEETYWVCTDAGYQCECRWTNDMYGLGANKWSKWGWHIMDKPQYSKIIAYMPLPEPYKEGEDE